jgi:methylation protein EvaC
MHSILAGIKLLLKPNGVVMFEDPYLGDIVSKTSYDQIYDEHAFYFSLASVNNMFKRHEMEVFDVMAQNVHGGSMRYLIGHKGKHEISKSLEHQRSIEQTLGLHKPETYRKLKGNVEKSRDQLISLLRDLKKQGKRVVGYGATSKSTTVTNYCGITPDLVEFISDTTPIKQNKFSPGVHIPVKHYDEFVKKYPEYALLFAWNHGEEIIAKESKFLANGGKFILYVPTVHISNAVTK